MINIALGMGSDFSVEIVEDDPPAPTGVTSPANPVGGPDRRAFIVTGAAAAVVLPVQLKFDFIVFTDAQEEHEHDAAAWNRHRRRR